MYTKLCKNLVNRLPNRIKKAQYLLIQNSINNNNEGKQSKWVTEFFLEHRHVAYQNKCLSMSFTMGQVCGCCWPWCGCCCQGIHSLLLHHRDVIYQIQCLDLRITVGQVCRCCWPWCCCCYHGISSSSWNIVMWHIKSNVSVWALQWDRFAVAVDHGVVVVTMGFLVFHGT